MFNRIKDIIFKIKDYDRLEYDYSAVLCHVTDGRLSKTGYEINGLLTQLSDMLTEGYYHGYEDAEKDLALTKDDVWCVFNLVRELQTKYPATEGCLQEVADIFNEQRKK